MRSVASPTNHIKSLCFKVEPALPSWNEIYCSPHWTVRSKLQQTWKVVVAGHLKAHLAHVGIKLKTGEILFNEPVKITATNYAPRPMDAWNIYTKCLDALEGIVIVSDGWKHVISTECITRKAKKSFASIEIEVITGLTSIK